MLADGRCYLVRAKCDALLSWGWLSQKMQPDSSSSGELNAGRPVAITMLAMVSHRALFHSTPFIAAWIESIASVSSIISAFPRAAHPLPLEASLHLLQIRVKYAI